MSAASSSTAKKRGAVKVNPVTGKLEKSEGLQEGLHRDGMLQLSDKYINAARDAGLGNASGKQQQVIQNGSSISFFLITLWLN